MTRRQNRLLWIGMIGSVLTVAVGLMLYAQRAGISVAISPSEVRQANIPAGQNFRLFGLVEEGSVERGDGLQVKFVLSDGDEKIAVQFNDILPDLFREKQGIMTEGALHPNGEFVASKVFAKHDENYMPAGVADKLKEKGVWKGGDQ